jgi:hypothetical protein
MPVPSQGHYGFHSFPAQHERIGFRSFIKMREHEKIGFRSFIKMRQHEQFGTENCKKSPYKTFIWIMTFLCVSLGFISLWFGLWCLSPLSTTFQLYRGGQF